MSSGPPRFLQSKYDAKYVYRPDNSDPIGIKHVETAVTTVLTKLSILSGSDIIPPYSIDCKLRAQNINKSIFYLL